MNVTIHAEPQIKWQGPFAEKMAAGLKQLGIAFETTNERSRVSDAPAILLGTTLWREVEATGRYLLVDRCSFGDTNRYVSLVLNGHGRRGDHCAPRHPNPRRWETHGVEVLPWRTGAGFSVLAGQCEPYSPKWQSMGEWYRSVMNVCTHFRPHPAEPINQTLLPVWSSFEGVSRMVTLNSSVAIDAILRGIPTVVEDEGGMAWPGFRVADDRLPWLHWLAWTQWHHDEIAAGEPIRHLFEHIA